MREGHGRGTLFVVRGSLFVVRCLLSVFRRPCVEALSGGFIDLAALALADGKHDKHDLFSIYPIHQPITQVAQFYFVAVGHAGERRLRDARFLQAAFEHLEKLELDAAVELVPLLTRGGQKLELITWHAQRFRVLRRRLLRHRPDD